jgi:hypothetical protein
VYSSRGDIGRDQPFREQPDALSGAIAASVSALPSRRRRETGVHVWTVPSGRTIDHGMIRPLRLVTIKACASSSVIVSGSPCSVR